MSRNLLTLFALSLSILLNKGCSTLPDVLLCTEINIERGYCVNTVSKKEFYVDETNLLEGKTWFELRPYMIYMPIESWVKIKSYLLKECKRYKKCPQLQGPIESVDKLSK
jgi:hypothetical protein